jgi:hypothetical protein
MAGAGVCRRAVPASVDIQRPTTISRRLVLTPTLDRAPCAALDRATSDKVVGVRPGAARKSRECMQAKGNFEAGEGVALCINDIIEKPRPAFSAAMPPAYSPSSQLPSTDWGSSFRRNAVSVRGTR